MEEKKRIISKADVISDLVVGAVLIGVVVYALLTPGGWFTGLVALLGLATLVNLYIKQKEAGILNRDSADILAVLKSEKDELAEKVRRLKAEKTSLGRALDSASEERDKYQTEYQKISKQLEEVTGNLSKTEGKEPESTSADKKPRKRQYTKKDVARIKSELRSVNLKPKDDAESGK